jgi:hypothetical protein
MLTTLTILYFLLASVTTFDIRLTQAKRAGDVPPDEPLPGRWVNIFYWAQWGVAIAMLWMNWRYALSMILIRFLLSLTPILELLGNLLLGVLTAPFRKSRRDGGNRKCR